MFLVAAYVSYASFFAAGPFDPLPRVVVDPAVCKERHAGLPVVVAFTRAPSGEVGNVASLIVLRFLELIDNHCVNLVQSDVLSEVGADVDALKPEQIAKVLAAADGPLVVLVSMPVDFSRPTPRSTSLKVELHLKILSAYGE